MKTLLTFLFVAFSQVAIWAQVIIMPVAPAAPVIPIVPVAPVVPQRVMPAQNMDMAAPAAVVRPAPVIVAQPQPPAAAREVHAHMHEECDCSRFPYRPSGCDPSRCHAAMLRCASYADLVNRLNLSGTLADKITRFASSSSDYEYIQQIQYSLSPAEYNTINQSIMNLGEEDKAYIYNRCK